MSYTVQSRSLGGIVYNYSKATVTVAWSTADCLENVIGVQRTWNETSRFVLRAAMQCTHSGHVDYCNAIVPWSFVDCSCRLSIGVGHIMKK